ncbi:sodium:calcium antiporter [Domibacillus indicus]|uniref:sodium:calcium antiporter n=1 Tax=Domibacillus indicus TaxID=1437523 RepID=UPI000617AECE|nr:sodium:calcium antiporter [Domibacillus indicus]
MLFVLFTLFFTAAVSTILAAIALSRYADELSGKTSLGGLLVGTVFLAGATSLPEVTTSLSAVFIGNPDIAIGNMIGSNMFNLFIIACFDVWYRKIRLYQSVSSEHKYTAGLGLLLSLMLLLALTRQSAYTVYGIGSDTLFIAFACILGMYIVSRISHPETLETNQEPAGSLNAFSLKKTITAFALMAVVITGAGSMLSFTGDEIARVTGIDASFVGSFLLAATTSMPEAIAVLVALRLKNVNLALGSILGSNVFNILILTGSDVFYRQGPILSEVSPILQSTSASTAILSSLLLLALLRRKRMPAFRYLIPSILIIVLYLYFSYFSFVS